MAKSAGSWSKPSGVPNLIGRKQVDWSIFEYGTTVPIDFHAEFWAANGGERLDRGDSREITLLVEGRHYNATLINVDRTSVATDTLQIRYDSNTELKKLLRDRLRVSYEHLKNEREKRAGKGRKVYANVPTRLAEYLEFYDTGTPYFYRVVLCPPKEQIDASIAAIISRDGDNEKAIEAVLNGFDEEQFQRWLESTDGSASIEEKEGLARFRRYQRSVIDQLKAHYGGRCQICGWTSMTDFLIDVSEGHHLRGFAQSLDNSPTNICVLCPTHHRLVHALGATFDSGSKAFVCPDGRRFALTVNYHL